MFCVMRSLCSRSCQQSRIILAQRFLTLRPTTSVKLANETFEEKNERLKRPMSPHLSIYKPQISSILSITHRITGLMMFTYVSIIGELFSVTDDVVLYLQSLNLSESTWIGIKTLLAMPFTYHFTSGVRHLIMDSGLALTNRGVNISFYVCSVLMVFLAWNLAHI